MCLPVYVHVSLRMLALLRKPFLMLSFASDTNIDGECSSDALELAKGLCGWSVSQSYVILHWNNLHSTGSTSIGDQ